MDVDSLVAEASQEFGSPLRFAGVLPGGLNGVTVRVAHDEGFRVVKWVPAAEREMFVNGALAAHRVAVAGVLSGAPLPTRTGALTASVSGGEMVLMPFVEGPLLADGPRDQADMADVLLRAHVGTETASTGPFSLAEWLRPREGELLPDWVMSTAAAALREFDGLPPTRWCTVNGDPSPDEFRRTSQGVALLDWGSATVGPALYDVATLCMYLGGPVRSRAFLDRYRAGDDRSAHDLAQLPCFMRLRAAVQAMYFARRIAADPPESERSGNDRGLEDARGMVLEWGEPASAC